MTAEVTGFYDERTSTISYVVADPESGAAAVVDPVLDFDPHSGRTFTETADRICAHVAERGLDLRWILDTHAHADHLSAAALLKKRLGAPVAIGKHIVDIQETWKRIYNLDDGFRTDGSQFDRLLDDDDELPLGGLTIRVLYTPGHTPDSVSYLVDGCVFVGDTLFMPDYGTARADFPGADARQLYRSIRRLLDLPPDTQLFMCHDYRPGGRDVAWETTVATQREANIHIGDGVSEDDFVAMRKERDRTLSTPALLLSAIQVNMRAGQLPPAESNGRHYLKIPVDAL